jgi:hypothetical protein
MPSITFHSRTFGRDPADLCEAKQQRELRKAAAQQPVKRPVLTARTGWSEARKRAEELFTLPRPVRET